MNIENSIPQGWKLGYIVDTSKGYECQLDSVEDDTYTLYILGSTPTEAFTKACDKARQYNIQKLMEECMTREDL